MFPVSIVVEECELRIFANCTHWEVESGYQVTFLISCQ